MIYYISDMHLGDYGIMKYQSHGRFKSVEERDQTIIDNFNARVKRDDDVYILGDVISHAHRSYAHYLRQLNGQKHLIAGNHDHDLVRDNKARSYFVSIDEIKYIVDGEHKIILCHYPMAEWNGYQKGVCHVYGHIHDHENLSGAFMQFLLKQGILALNAAVMVNDYQPVTFDEMLQNNRNRMNGVNTASQISEDIPLDMEFADEWQTRRRGE